MISSNQFYTNPFREDIDYKKAQRIKAVEKANLDSLETVQQRLERELLEKFSSQKKNALSGYFIIYKIGKFFVVVCLFPAHILFLSLPKRIFPFVATAYKQGSTALSSILNHLAAKCRVLKDAFLIFTEKYVNGPSKKIGHKIAEVSSILMAEMIHLAMKAVIPPWLLVQKQVKKFQFFSQKFKEIAIKPVQNFKKSFSGILSRLKEVFSFQKINVASWIPEIKMPKIALGPFLMTARLLKDKAAEEVSRAKKKIQEMASATAKIIESSWFYLWQPASQIRLPQYHLSPRLGTKIKEFYLSGKKIGKNFSKLVFEKGKTILEKTLTQFTDVAKKCFNPIKEQWLKTYHLAIKSMQQLKKSLLKRFNGKGKAKKRWDLLKKKLDAFYRRGKEKVLDFKRHLSFAWLKRLGLFINRFMQNFFFSLRILYAIICLFIKLFIQQMKKQMLKEIYSED
ncbi:hypothetical protein PHSC3_002008 [Chlamydiales bacterium STE3]|nr:hypothetical protein PHSC3_002008 [Chlamydiales bacterium STE3]